MLKLIALNYTVMLNGYSQWLNIKGKNNFILFNSIFLSIDSTKQTLDADLLIQYSKAKVYLELYL